ncbi:MAG: beta-propeller fold lactonase family protein, partial [Planctomycetes bacterium]|nr:beta-propeller fold lactonase family protein [Planctomycetota bacterium]
MSSAHQLGSSIRSTSSFALLLAAACGGGGHPAPSPLAPRALVYPRERVIDVVDVLSETLAPSVQGVVERYTIAPALPLGLALDEHTGLLSGRATAVAAARVYTITASNAGGSASTALELAVAPAPRFAYALSGSDATITLFGVDPESGRLLRKGYQAAPDGASLGEQLCVHPTEAFLYAPNAGTQSIAAFAIDPSEGWLTPRASAAAGPGPHRMALVPNGRFAFATSGLGSELFGFDVDPITGELLNRRAPIACGTHPTDVAIDPTGRFLFLAYAGANGTGAGAGVQAYAIDAASGALSPSGPAVALDGLAPSGLRVDPARNALYVTLAQSDSVLPIRYHQSTGALAALTANAAGDGPDALAIDPLGRFTFVANESSSNVSSYRVDTLSGELVPSSTVTAGLQPTAVAIDTAGRFLYVTNKGSSDVMLFGIEDADGALSKLDAWSVRSTPADFAIVRGPRAPVLRTRFLHVANGGSSDVSAYTVDALTGSATERLPTSPTSAGPSAIAIHPRHRFAWVVEREGRSLGAYRVDGSTGALVQNGPAELVLGTPWSASIEPSGRFLYLLRRDVLAADDGFLSTYAIDATDGTLHFVTTQPVGPRPVHVDADPTGRWLHVANIGAPSTLQAFQIDTLTGRPTQSGAPAPAPGIHTFAYHPNGRSLVAALRTANTLVRYTLDPNTGEPQPIAGGSRAGREPIAIQFTPDGRFALAAYADTQDQEDGGHVTLFPVDASGALLPPGNSYEAGSHPSSLTLSPTGRHVYATNSSTHDLSTFTLDPATATLYPQPPS